MKNTILHPPKLAQRLLRWHAGKADMEDLNGDLDELYLFHRSSNGKLKADLIYWQQVLSLLFSYALQKRKKNSSYSNYYTNNSFAMIKNYFKIAIRNFVKQRFFTVINVFGLAMGMSVSLLILAIISQVFQFDYFQANKDHIYRVLTDIKSQDSKKTYASAPLALYDELKDNYTGIKNVVRINHRLNLDINHNENEISISGIYTDPNYFDVFSFDLARGDKKTALLEPNCIILSKELVEKLYPNTDPIGLIMQTKDQGDFKITGILAEHPRQTHLNVEALASFKTIESSINTIDRWSDFYQTYIYVYLSPDKTKEDLAASLKNISTKATPFFEDTTIDFKLQAFTDISPGRDLYNDLTPFDWVTSIFLFCLGLLILIPACFNYTNLMIARGLKRAKEIGIRKVVGSNRRQITFQFIVEAVMLTLFALIGSIFIFTMIRDEFSSMVIGSNTLDLTLSVNMIIWFIVFGLLTGVVAGIFPANYFSKIEPLKSLKSEIQTGKSASISNVRKWLIVAQFSLSLIFIIGIGVVIKQYKDVIKYDLGFDKENILAIPLKGLDHELITSEMTSVTGVNSVCLSSNLPGIEAGLQNVVVKQVDNKEDSISSYQMFVNEDFIPSMGFKTMWGESLSKSGTHSVEPFLVNEEFMRISRNVNKGSDSLNFMLDKNQRGIIVGVIKDFNFMQLNSTIKPLIIRNNPDRTQYALLSVESKNTIEMLEQLESKWVSIDNEIPFESFFLDQEIEESYQSALGMVKVFAFLGALSLSISCIGLLGMVVYFTENRVKEVAVRKIMGASLLDLFKALGGSFFKLLIIAISIASPIAYLFYDKVFVRLISKFSVGVGWIEMVASILFMLIISLLPILWMITKISKVNPAGNLRHE